MLCRKNLKADYTHKIRYFLLFLIKLSKKYTDIWLLNMSEIGREGYQSRQHSVYGIS